MINLLMSDPPIILQDIIILRPRRLDQFLQHRLPRKSVPILTFLPTPFPPPQIWDVTYQNLTQLVIRDINQLLAVVFRDNELLPHH
jgi:hypothetical protein